MPPSDDGLAAAQSALLGALTGRGPTPDGFARTRIDAMGEILLAKRRKAAAHACPALMPHLGSRFAPLFSEYAGACATRRSEDADLDIADFLRWLSARGLLTPGLRGTLLRLNVRRGFPLRLRWSRMDRCLLVAYRLPRGDTRLFAVKMAPRGSDPGVT